MCLLREGKTYGDAPPLPFGLRGIDAGSTFVEEACGEDKEDLLGLQTLPQRGFSRRRTPGHGARSSQPQKRLFFLRSAHKGGEGVAEHLKPGEREVQSDFQAKRIPAYEERFLRQGDGERGNAGRLVDSRAQKDAEVYHGLPLFAVGIRKKEKGAERPFDVRGVAQKRFALPPLRAVRGIRGCA